MAALIIPSMPTFGAMTNQAVSRLVGLNTTIPRLQEAIATAASGYEGIAGTEYEASGGGLNMAVTNNFGVQPDPAAAGKNGTAYAYAVGELANAWATFWTAAAPFIEQLDNGSTML